VGKIEKVREPVRGENTGEKPGCTDRAAEVPGSKHHACVGELRPPPTPFTAKRSARNQGRRRKGS